MKPSDIIIGAYYSHEKWPKSQVKYLGCGKYGGKGKCLIKIVDKIYPLLPIGTMVLAPNKCDEPNFWKGFTKL